MKSIKINKINRIHIYSRKELIKITTERFCKRHNVKSIKEYQELLGEENNDNSR